MNGSWWSIGFGASITLAWLGFWGSRAWSWAEFRDQVFGTARPASRRRRPWALLGKWLQPEMTTLGTPEQAGLWRRATILATALVLVLTVLLRSVGWLVLVPAIWSAPMVVARVKERAYRRKLAKQTRVVEMLMAFLVRAGATLSDTLLMLERQMEAPMQDKLREVNVHKRYSTLPGALEALADSAGVPQLREFASLVSESERNGTPVADAILRSIRLDMKMRDASAAERYGKVQLEVAMYATLLIAMPGFGFAVYAMLMFALRMFGSWSF